MQSWGLRGIHASRFRRCLRRPGRSVLILSMATVKEKHGVANPDLSRAALLLGHILNPYILFAIVSCCPHAVDVPSEPRRGLVAGVDCSVSRVAMLFMHALSMADILFPCCSEIREGGEVWEFLVVCSQPRRDLQVSLTRNHVGDDDRKGHRGLLEVSRGIRMAGMPVSNFHHGGGSRCGIAYRGLSFAGLWGN